MAATIETPQRILDEALLLFAQKGYEATSVSDIAGAVGIKAPSLYKHYASKQAIFDALVARELERHEQARANLDGGVGGLEQDALAYSAKTPEGMAQLSCGLFDHWTSGDAALFRQMLSVERLRSPEMAQLYTSLFLTGPIEYQSKLFGLFMEKGYFRQSDPAALALQFWGPLFLLMQLADAGDDRERLKYLVTKHVVSFGKANGSEGENA